MTESELMKGYANLVTKIAKRFVSDSIELDDLIQEGLLALLLAHRNFDENKDDFKSYVSAKIKFALIDYVSKQQTPTIPNRDSRGKRAYKQGVNLLASDATDIMSVETHPDEVNLPPDIAKKIKKIKEKIKNTKNKDYSEIIKDITAMDKIIDIDVDELPGAQPVDMIQRLDLKEAFSTLTPSEKLVVQLKIAGYSFKEINEFVAGNANTRGRNLYNKAIKKLKKYMDL